MPAVFITIPLSHYCEKARWALDRSGLPYREEPHAPLFHLLAARRNRDGAVPVLIDGNTRLSDSTDILVHADAYRGGDLLYPREPALRSEVEALEEQFDSTLGPHARRWAYSHLLTQAKLLTSVWSRGVSRFEAKLVPVIAPLARRLVRSGYKITPEGSERSLARVREVFQQVAERLRPGRRFLVGERFSAADLTFAALAAPVLFPPGCRATHPALEDVPLAMREIVLQLRGTEAGIFALRLFAEERAPIPTVLVQQAGREELAIARELFVEYASHIGIDLEYQGFSAELAGLPGKYAPPSGALLLARIDGQVAGCVALRALDRETVEMKRLYVRPGARGAGLGRRLVEAAVAIARQGAYSELRLDTLATMNSARALYRSLGFVEIPPYGDAHLPGTVFYGLSLID